MTAKMEKALIGIIVTLVVMVVCMVFAPIGNGCGQHIWEESKCKVIQK